MLGFHGSEVAHAYGNKNFRLYEVEFLAPVTGDESVAVELRSKRESDVAPVQLHLTPDDAVKLGEALAQSGRNHLPKHLQ